jgi:hypothetical protein
MSFIPIYPQRPSRSGDSYAEMCHYRRLHFTALALWLAGKPQASDIDDELAATYSALRQLVELAKAGV